MCVAETFRAVRHHDHHESPEPGHDGSSMSRRHFFRAGAAAGAGLALTAALPRSAWAAEQSPSGATKAMGGKGLVDLTHVLRDGFPVFPAFANPKRVTLSTVSTEGRSTL